MDVSAAHTGAAYNNSNDFDPTAILRAQPNNNLQLKGTTTYRRDDSWMRRPTDAMTHRRGSDPTAIITTHGLGTG
jgi:hypothetical protein